MSWEAPYNLIWWINDGDALRKGRVLQFRVGRQKYLGFRGYGTRGRLIFWQWKHDFQHSTYRRELGRGRWALDLWLFAVVWEDFAR